jgi:putative ABC transport system permease protein
MSRVKGWFLRVRRAVNPRAFEAQMADEMRQHLEMEAAAHRAAGEDDLRARRAAAIDFGAAEAYKEQIRDRRLGRWLAEARQDLVQALRLMRRTPGFSAAVIVTIGLAIGLNTAIFAAVNAVMLQPVDVPAGDRLVTVADISFHRTMRGELSWPDYLAYRDRNQVFDGIEAGFQESVSLGENDLPTGQYDLMRVSPGLFDLIRTPPILGRPFNPADGRADAEPVALIGHDLWQSRYGGADVVGRAVRINGVPATIIGVMPRNFKFPADRDLWMPYVPTGEFGKRSLRELTLFALLKPGLTEAQANQDLARINRELIAEFPGELDPKMIVLARNLPEAYLRAARPRTILLFIAVVLVLAVACANVANLMLSRGLARQREISMRAALGASRGRLVRQLLMESVLLGLAGGALGLALALLGTRGLQRLAATGAELPYWVHIEIDPAVLLFLTLVSILCSVLFGLMPAWRSTRVDLNSVLKNGASPGATSRESRLVGVMTVLQFALSVTLLSGAGMLWRSSQELDHYNTMVPATRILTGSIKLPNKPGQAYVPADTRRRFVTALQTQLQALPGVTHASIAAQLPGLGARRSAIEIEGTAAVPVEQAPRISFIVQSPQHLETVGLALREGRSISTTDGRPGQEVVIVTAAFTRRYWPGESAIGKRFRLLTANRPPGPWMEIIGECTDFLENPTLPAPEPMALIPYEEAPVAQFYILLRTTGEPAGLAAAAREVVRKLDPDVAVVQLQPLPDALDELRWSSRTFGLVFLIFAVTGLLTSAVGIYATVACATSRRIREIGIRLALGATARQVVRLILSRGLQQMIAGVSLGLLGGWYFVQLLSKAGLIFQLPSGGFLWMLALALFAMAVGLVASLLPARRATRVSPVESLRVE